MSINSLEQKFRQNTEKGRKTLIPFLPGGYPTKEKFWEYILAMDRLGADIIEIGVPFSDPVADGPLIEKANHKALELGFKFEHLKEISKAIAPHIDTLWMGYFNPFYQKGIENIPKKAKEIGVNGFIIPDLPHEEAISYKNIFSKYNIALIDFVAPTDTKERIQKIVKNSSKFIYLVAYAGITGSDKKEDLQNIIQNIRLFTKTPVYIGFGVNKQTAKEKSKNVDGVIVGSAFVKILTNSNLTVSQKIDKITLLTREIKTLINE